MSYKPVYICSRRKTVDEFNQSAIEEYSKGNPTTTYQAKYDGPLTTELHPNTNSSLIYRDTKNFLNSTAFRSTILSYIQFNEFNNSIIQTVGKNGMFFSKFCKSGD